MVKEYLKLMRIPQWIKNFFVFVPLIFSMHLFDSRYFLTVLGGFFLFCFTTSAVYIINDIFDAEADRAHPFKKMRPVASGKISKQAAAVFAGILILVVLLFVIGYNFAFIIALTAYFVLNVLYSTVLKKIVLLDIFSIAAGFIIRVIAGALIINVEISSWLLLTTLFISLFLAVMKRQSELRLNIEESGIQTRKVLSQYSLEFTNQMATVTASGVIICYALYSVSARTVKVFGSENLIYTTPFVVFGIFRYMFLVYLNRKGENTTEVMITDLPMIITALLYILTTTLIIYKVL